MDSGQVQINNQGQVIQTLTEAAPDPATPTTPRWTASGRVELNNKGDIVRQFEPFYTSSISYDFVAVGVSATLSYDPLGRNTRVDLPDGHFRRLLYAPWGLQVWDENDNLSTSPHYQTPSSTVLDALGRPFKSIELLTPSSPLETLVQLDISGNPLSVTDARGNIIQVQQCDMLGRALFTGSRPRTAPMKATTLPPPPSTRARTVRCPTSSASPSIPGAAEA